MEWRRNGTRERERHKGRGRIREEEVDGARGDERGMRKRGKMVQGVCITHAYIHTYMRSYVRWINWKEEEVFIGRTGLTGGTSHPIVLLHVLYV